MNQNRYTLISPSIPRDLDTLINNSNIFFRFLPIKNILVIGDSKVKMRIQDLEGFEFLDENEIIDCNIVHNLIIQKSGNEGVKRAGWYIQQFIKLAYSRMCEDDYYLIWDSDTIPVKNIDLFSPEGVPYFDIKTEYHKQYFETISNLFDGLDKQIKGSFISEHMVVNTSIMKKMIEFIENNDKLFGNTFYEKIINSISPVYLPYCGFSEFETYGSFATKYYNSSYKYRKWNSMRYAGFFYSQNEKDTNKSFQWLSKNYDAISIEKNHYLSCFSRIINKNIFQKLFSSKILEFLSCIIRIKRRFI